MEIFSILGIFARFSHNVFLSFLHLYNTNYKDATAFALEGYTILDLIYSPIYLIMYFLFQKHVTKANVKKNSLLNSKETV